jgi:hypothetical protein
MALRDPKRFPGVLDDPVAHWEGLARRSGRGSESGKALATLLLASVRGLLLDLVATGDRARVGRAAKRLEVLARSQEAMN